jgi:hypothetical protein
VNATIAAVSAFIAMSALVFDIIKTHLDRKSNEEREKQRSENEKIQHIKFLFYILCQIRMKLIVLLSYTGRDLSPFEYKIIAVTLDELYGLIKQIEIKTLHLVLDDDEMVILLFLDLHISEIFKSFKTLSDEIADKKKSLPNLLDGTDTTSKILKLKNDVEIVQKSFLDRVDLGKLKECAEYKTIFDK